MLLFKKAVGQAAGESYVPTAQKQQKKAKQKVTNS
jgi:hypothetical protein